MFGRIRAVIKATTLELVSEPLFFLLTISAVGVLTIASYLHVHQFGEPSRMARDVGLSSVLIFGIVFAVFSAIRVFRREIESGTLQMALSRPISRELFFLSKTAGAFLACIVFFVIVFSSTITTVVGAEVGKIHTEMAMSAASHGHCHHDIMPETLWFVSLGVDACTIVLPLVFGAVLNRFARFRFTTTAFAVALVVSVSGCFYNIHLACAEFGDAVSFIPAYVKRILPVGVLLLAPVAVFLSAAAALSVKFKDNAVASFSGLIFLLFLPALGNYYQTQALHRGGELPWSYVVWSFAAALPFVVAFLLMGVFFMRSKDVG